MFTFYTAARGQGLLEYALIMAFIAIVVVVVLALVGPFVANLYSSIIPLI
jgi:Flp pilus assembly pilin Flp